MSHLSLRLITFLKSLWFHIWLGFPKSSQKEINERYNICLSCKDFDSKNSQCTICGCNINNKKIFLNKLAWADQECPIGKWKKNDR
jgi:uncharacterized paraquat-inducible protein A